MFDNLQKKLYHTFEAIWEQGHAWPDFVETMRLALIPALGVDDREQNSLSWWMLLPALCCQAAGGEPHWADDLTAAWILFSRAASILDHVEDKDQPDPWWREIGPGAAVNTALGLCFTASQSLNHLFIQERTSSAAKDIVEDFYASLLAMSSGQHRDLMQPSPTLEQCWEVASAKSGTFFSLACRAGARLATKDTSTIEGYSRFGHHLGVLVQIYDDLEEIYLLKKAEPLEPAPDFGRSLAVIFALEVYPPELCASLKYILQSAVHEKESAVRAYQLIEQSGAALFLSTELERHQSQAQAALEQAGALSPAKETLVNILRKLVSN